jgi:hypothetical protein
MTHAVAKTQSIKFPASLAEFLDDPPLVGDETLEGYNNFFAAIIAAANPADPIDWLYLKDVVDLFWQIRRERKVLASVVNLHQTEVVRDLLKATANASNALEAAVYRIFDASDDAQRWASDPTARKEIEARLTAKGHPASATLAEAYKRGANDIDAIDKRIASYEARRTGIIREIELRNVRFARDLNTASSPVIDGEFSEAAE